MCVHTHAKMKIGECPKPLFLFFSHVVNLEFNTAHSHAIAEHSTNRVLNKHIDTLQQKITE